jgi:chromosome segregation ATPase
MESFLFDCGEESIMSLIKCLILGCVLSVVTFFYVSPTRTLAQTRQPAESAQGDRDQTLQQLLTEVRELRLAIQRATVNNTRFQMLIERVRIQQGHVDVLSRQLEDVLSPVAEMRTRKAQLEQVIKDAENLLDRTAELNAHAELESRIKIMKINLASLAQEEERLRNREAALDTELQAAQSKLNELNSQLDALMSDLKGP